MCKNLVSLNDSRCVWCFFFFFLAEQSLWFNMTACEIALSPRKAHKATAGGKQTYLQSALKPINFPLVSLKLQIGAADDWVEINLGTRKENSLMWKYNFSRQESSVHLLSIVRVCPSLPLLTRGGGGRGGKNRRAGGLSLRPECLAVFKWHTRTCFCLPRQIHCGGRWANTHTNTNTSSLQDTDLCVLAFVSMQAGNQVLSYGVSGRRESLWQPA